MKTLSPPPKHANAESWGLDDSELDSIRSRRPLSIRRWTEKHLMITEGPLAVGEPIHWSPRTFPPQATILEALERPSSLVCVLTAPQ